MATYYVRKTGNDGSAGTSPASAWRTIGKLLGASGMGNGDTAYIGAGVYRETVTLNLTSPSSETKVYGDVLGVFTGDMGDVVISGYTTSDTVAPTSSTLFNMNGADHMTFEDLIFINGNNFCVYAAGGSLSSDITFRRCHFQSGMGNFQLINVLSSANTALNWLIDSCTFRKPTNVPCVQFVLTRPSGADYDVNVLIKNCLFWAGNSTSIHVGATGANTFNAGGVTVLNCTQDGNGAFINLPSGNISTTYPVKAYNNFVNNHTGAFTAITLGTLVEDWNILHSGATPRTNVNSGTHSISSGAYAQMYYSAIEYIQRGLLRPFWMPKPGSSMLGYGNQSGAPSVDIIEKTRPTGAVIVGPPYVTSDYGTATAGGAKTLTNSGKNWGTNAFTEYTVRILAGTGAGQVKSIASNTATVLTVDGNWLTQPDNTSVYEIYLRRTASSGQATAGSTTTLTDGNAAWGTNMWAGFTLEITAGTASGNTYVISSNTGTVLTFPAGTAVDNTSQYVLYRATDETTTNPGVGAYEGYDDSGQLYPFKRMNRRQVIRHDVNGKLER